MHLTKEEKAEITKSYKLHKDDTGSAQYQISLLNHKIRRLTEHLQQNKHDFLAKRSVQSSVSQMKSMLKYVKRKNVESYKELTKGLGLRG